MGGWIMAVVALALQLQAQLCCRTATYQQAGRCMCQHCTQPRRCPTLPSTRIDTLHLLTHPPSNLSRPAGWRDVPSVCTRWDEGGRAGWGGAGGRSGDGELGDWRALASLCRLTPPPTGQP